jgi:hypothetical protein
MPVFQDAESGSERRRSLETVRGEMKDDLHEVMTRYVYTSGCHVWRMFSAYVYVDLFIGTPFRP